jgi:long-chain fatty acid transport protein
MRGARTLFAAALALASGLACARSAEASPEDLFGYGARTSAMGATGAAHATGYETAFHNPALASGIRANKLTLGWLGAVFRLDAEGAGLPGRVSATPATGTFIGAELPIPLRGKLTNRLGLALAFYEPTDVVVRGRVLYPEKTQFPILPDRAQSVTIRAALGADLGYGLRVGAGFAALAEIVGDVVAATDATGRVGTRVEDQLVATYAPEIGLTYDLPVADRDATWRVGLAYRGTLDARFSVTIDGSKLSSLNIPLFNISGLAQYDPAQLVLEGARIEALNTLALQVAFKRWSSFPGILEPTVVCSDGGPGACGLSPPKIDWRDTFAVRAGGDQGFELRRGLTLHARAGAFFETSPLPSELPGADAYDVSTRGQVTLPTRYFDASRLGLTGGFGVAMARPLPPVDLDLFAEEQLLLPRTITSRDEAGVTLSEGKASGHVTVFGMTAGVRF